MPYPSTFSIVAFDPEAREWGVAVQSKFLAVGPVVPWAEAEVGAIATQSFANTSYGPQGLALLKSGLSARVTLEKLIAEDEDSSQRQVGIVDRNGGSASYTGPSCFDWAGHLTGDGFACQGNILTGEAVVQAMADSFRASSGPLAERLISALHAGQAAGGDSRGQQSASLNVVKENGGYGGYTDRLIDLRVDDHVTPIAELERIYKLHLLYFGETTNLISLDPDSIGSIQKMLRELAYYSGEITRTLDDATQKAIRSFHNVENLEMRWIDEPHQLDKAVLEYLEQKYRQINK